MSDIKLIRTDGNNQAFISLCHLLDDFLNEVAGGEEKRSQYMPYNALEDIHDVVIVYCGNDPVGCASFKHYEKNVAEVKRVYVKEAYRGKGVSRKLLMELEQMALEKDYADFVLETGEPLAEATSLYRNIGYTVIPNYGPYKDMPESICMKKHLKKSLQEMSLDELWELFPIILAEHNPAYKEWYATEKISLVNTLGKENVERISHIGSTSIEGLIAKPTVDILLEIKDTCDTEELKEDLLQAGWLLMSEDEKQDVRLVLNKGYTINGFAEKVYHLHVRSLYDWDELYFRDYLRAHRDVAFAYGEFKKQLKVTYEHDRDGYTEAKTAFIKQYTTLAREEFGGRYLPPERS